MTGIDRVRADAQYYGLSLPEYLIVHVATSFAMTPEQATGCVANVTKVSSQEALESCVQKGFVTVSRAGTLTVTQEGIVATSQHPSAVDSD